MRDTGRSFALGEVSANRRLRTNIEKLATIPTLLCPGQTNVIYANGANEAELIALRIAAETKNTEPPPRLSAHLRS